MNNANGTPIPPTEKLRGIHSALVTPFNRHGEIDCGALAELIAHQRMDGINGLVMAGTTGESPVLDMKERQGLVGCAKENAPSMAIIAGAGANSTKHAIELQKAMEDAGADATLQVVPYYNKPTERGLIEHFSAIAHAARVPVILYNAPGRTGAELSPSTIATIAKNCEMVVGIKDCNTNTDRLSELMHLRREVRPEFLVLCGEDSALFSYLTHGGDGAIAVTSQIAAAEMLTVYRCVMNGDLAYAQKISAKLAGLYRLVFSHSNPIPIKTILSSMGLMEKSWRLPLCALEPEQENVLLDRCKDFAFLQSFKARGFCQ